MGIAVLLLIAVQVPQSKDIVVEKKNPAVCNTVKMTGSRLRTVRRCTKAKPDPDEKLDELEAQRAIDQILEQDRINHAACVQQPSSPMGRSC